MKLHLVTSFLLLCSITTAPTLSSTAEQIELFQKVTGKNTTDMVELRETALDHQPDRGSYSKRSRLFVFDWDWLLQDINKLTTEDNLRITFFENEICTPKTSKLQRDVTGNWAWSARCAETPMRFSMIINLERRSLAGDVSLSGGEATITSISDVHGIVYTVDRARLPRKTKRER